MPNTDIIEISELNSFMAKREFPSAKEWIEKNLEPKLINEIEDGPLIVKDSKDVYPKYWGMRELNHLKDVMDTLDRLYNKSCQR